MPAVADKLQPSADAGRAEADGAAQGVVHRVAAGERGDDSTCRTNRPLLDELASKSGGKVYTPEDVQELLDKLASREAFRIRSITEQRLWQWWTVFCRRVVSLLTVEWVVRKWSGLP